LFELLSALFNSLFLFCDGFYRAWVNYFVIQEAGGLKIAVGALKSLNSSLK